MLNIIIFFLIWKVMLLKWKAHAKQHVTFDY